MAKKDILLQEAAQAGSMGITYGKFKAMQYENQQRILEAREKLSKAQQLEIAQKEELDRIELARLSVKQVPERICPICNLPLLKTTRKQQRYHRGECADIAAEMARCRSQEKRDEIRRKRIEARKKANGIAV